MVLYDQAALGPKVKRNTIPVGADNVTIVDDKEDAGAEVNAAHCDGRIIAEDFGASIVD
jgi:hypothetical protein